MKTIKYFAACCMFIAVTIYAQPPVNIISVEPGCFCENVSPAEISA